VDGEATTTRLRFEEVSAHLHILVGIAVSAVALTLCQAPFDIGVLAPVALVPWLIQCRRLSALNAILSGALLGTAYVCVSAHWLVPAFASQGVVGMRSLLAAALTGFWTEGIAFGLVGWTAQRIRDRRPIEQAGILGVAIAACEYWTAHSAVGLPLLLLGHSQHSLPGVVQLAVATGVPGISALLIAMNSAVASLTTAQKGSRHLVVAIFASWLALVFIGEQAVEIIRPQQSFELRNILLVQPNFNRSQRWDPAFQEFLLNEIGAYTSKVVGSNSEPIDLIVFPENLLTQAFDDRNRLESILGEWVDTWNVPLVVGLTRNPPGTYRDRRDSPEFLNSSVWWSPQRGITDAVDKVRGVPFIESNRDFVGRTFLSAMLGMPRDHRRVIEAREASWLGDQFVITPTLCFEILFPAEVAKRRHPNSVAILNLADDSWVEGETADQQILAASAFRAVEQRLPLLRVGHGGLTGVIDSMGREVSVLPPDQLAHMTTRVAAASPASRSEKAAVVAIPVFAGGFAGLCMYMMSWSRSRCSDPESETAKQIDSNQDQDWRT
jgi:apolipoprotein N-acyltransferase